MDYESDGRKTAAFESEMEARAVGVNVADFSEQVSRGVLRALDDHHAGRPRTGDNGFWPWIWFGLWIGPIDRGGLGGGMTGPIGGGSGGGLDREA